MPYRLLRFVLLALLSSPLLIHAQNGLPLYDLPDPFAHPVIVSSSMAITQGGRLVVSNAHTEHISIVNPNTGELENEYAIGADPQGVHVTEDNLLALAVSRADGVLAVIDLESTELIASYPIGGAPYAVVAQDGLAYISLHDSHEILVVEIETGRIEQRIPTPEAPAALALWGDFLYMTHFWSGEFSMVYLPTGEVVRTILPVEGATLSQAIEIDPFSGRAFLPQSIANPNATTVDNRIIPVLHIIDLTMMQVAQQINFTVADRTVNMPFAADQPSNRSRLYVAHAGSQNVTVLNLDTGLADGHFAVGANPRSILFNRNFSRVYTQDAQDGTVTVIDTQFLSLADTIPSHTQLIDPLLQIGASLFHTANDPRLSAIPSISCSNCHYDRQSDNLIWAEAQTPVLQGAYDATIINAHIQAMQGGTGFDLNSLDLQALLSYIQQP